jgi:hypothetical protein
MAVEFAELCSAKRLVLTRISAPAKEYVKDLQRATDRADRLLLEEVSGWSVIFITAKVYGLHRIFIWHRACVLLALLTCTIGRISVSSQRPCAHSPRLHDHQNPGWGIFDRKCIFGRLQLQDTWAQALQERNVG